LPEIERRLAEYTAEQLEDDSLWQVAVLKMMKGKITPRPR
jgi:hypothetical protein